MPPSKPVQSGSMTSKQFVGIFVGTLSAQHPRYQQTALWPLTDTFIKALKHDPDASAGTKYSDGYGLYLHVKESGKYWRMAYRFGGKQKTLALGTYPTIGLAQARRKRDEAREQLASNVDPSLVKQAQKLALANAQEHSFEAVAREFHAIKRNAWSESYAEKWLRNDLAPAFPDTSYSQCSA